MIWIAISLALWFAVSIFTVLGWVTLLEWLAGPVEDGSEGPSKPTIGERSSALPR